MPHSILFLPACVGAPSESETRLRPKKRRMLQLSQIHRRNRFGETKVHEAVLNGNEQEVRDMIQLGASVNIPDYAGKRGPAPLSCCSSESWSVRQMV